jgi:hypothetical protein
MTFRVPTNFPLNLPETAEDNDNGLDDAQWYYYRYADDQCPAWPGLIATTNREKAKLTDIIRGATAMMYGPPSQIIQAHHILEQFRRYVSWREALPSVLGNLENNSQALPHVLSLMYGLPLWIYCIDAKYQIGSYIQIRCYFSFVHF